MEYSVSRICLLGLKIIPLYVYFGHFYHFDRMDCRFDQREKSCTVEHSEDCAILTAHLLRYRWRRFPYNAGSDFNRQNMPNWQYLTLMTRWLSLPNVF